MRLRRKAAFILGLVLSLRGVVAETNETGVWEKISNGLNESYVQSLAVTTGKEPSILAGTDKGIYRSSNENFFKNLISFTGEATKVNDIYADSNGLIFAATDSGLYKSSHQGKKFDRIYSSSDEEEKKCLAVLSDEKGVYLGTQKGLFYQPSGKTTWNKTFSVMNKTSVSQILKDNDSLYFVTDHKIFRLKDGHETIEEIFSERLNILEEVDLPSSDEDIIRNKMINHISVTDDHTIIVSSDNGLLYSTDDGESWKDIGLGAVAYKEINTILPVQSLCPTLDQRCLNFLAATDNGVFLYSNGKWTSLYKGMDAHVATDLDLYEGDSVIASTENGVYKLSLKETLALANAPSNLNPQINYDPLSSPFKNEPSIGEVQDLAIGYAEVHPDKIKEWRRKAQNKAWVPSLDIGVDGGKSFSHGDSVYGSSSGGGSHYVGPDDKSAAEDLGWDVSLSWDLADVIWSSDQTTIDSRSKLMVELREDILNQVTRLYYERRRLQMELAQAPSDASIILDQTMRVEELTAMIDGLTGGGFSRRIKDDTSHKSQGHK
ncbi:MAG: hypothetical protein KBD53_05820 [Candidatus Omnitrophica bacterium]|nr:hypothetical protein [Candidatus Omnitrophota bacterium]